MDENIADSAGAEPSEAPEDDIFYIEEIDVVPTDRLLTMRC